MLLRRTLRPSAVREKGVRPAPFSCTSQRAPALFTTCEGMHHCIHHSACLMMQMLSPSRCCGLETGFSLAAVASGIHTVTFL